MYCAVLPYFRQPKSFSEFRREVVRPAVRRSARPADEIIAKARRIEEAAARKRAGGR